MSDSLRPHLSFINSCMAFLYKQTTKNTILILSASFHQPIKSSWLTNIALVAIILRRKTIYIPSCQCHSCIDPKLSPVLSCVPQKPHWLWDSLIMGSKFGEISHKKCVDKRRNGQQQSTVATELAQTNL